MFLSDYYVIAGDNKYSLFIGVVSIHCMLKPLYDQQNTVYISVNYAMLQKDSCVIFQSFGDDAQLCSYSLNYIKPRKFNIENRRYSTRMKIQYHTYLRRQSRSKRNCNNRNAGVLVRTMVPENSLLQLYDNDTYMEQDVT